MKHPIQKPIMVGDVLRFTENRVVRVLLGMLEEHGQNLNHLEIEGCDLPKEDWDQFYQLLGHSLSGADIDSNIRDTAYKMHEMTMGEHEARAMAALETIKEIEDSIRKAVDVLSLT